MNRKELTQIIIGDITRNSSNDDIIRHLSLALEILKSQKIDNFSHLILDKKANIQHFNLEFNDDLSSVIDCIVAGNIHTALTHLENLLVRDFHYDDCVTPYELYTCISIIQSMIRKMLY
jgi:hypothetical protein